MEGGYNGPAAGAPDGFGTGVARGDRCLSLKKLQKIICGDVVLNKTWLPHTTHKYMRFAFLFATSRWKDLSYFSLSNQSQDHSGWKGLLEILQSFGTLTVRECFPVFRWNFMWYDLCQVSLVLAVNTVERSLAPS